MGAAHCCPQAEPQVGVGFGGNSSCGYDLKAEGTRATDNDILERFPESNLTVVTMTLRCGKQPKIFLHVTKTGSGQMVKSAALEDPMVSKKGYGRDLRADGHMEGQQTVTAKSTESMS